MIDGIAIIPAAQRFQNQLFAEFYRLFASERNVEQMRVLAPHSFPRRAVADRLQSEVKGSARVAIPYQIS